MGSCKKTYNYKDIDPKSEEEVILNKIPYTKYFKNGKIILFFNFILMIFSVTNFIFFWNPPFQKLFVLRKWNGFGSCSSEGLLIFKILELLEECFILHCMSPFFENGNLLSSLHHYCIVNIALHQIIKDIAWVLFRIRKYCTILP